MKGKASNIFVYILLGLLILGLAGFGVTSFGGNINSIGRVGQTEIEVEDYARALQTELRAATQQTGRSFTMADARATGLDRQVLASVVAETALAEEARRLQLSVGDARVADEVRSFPAFQGFNGGFDREAYRFTLESNGLTPQDFEEDIRVDTARTLLQAAVIAGLEAPAIYSETLFDFLAARRSFTVATLDASVLADPAPEPTEAELAAFHAANPDLFTEGETRNLTYAWLSPEMMEARIEVPEDELQAAYAARLDEFVQPERRILYRLVYPTEAEAAEAAARVAAGEVDFDQLVTDRGLALEDVELGEVARDDLDPAIAEPVFALDDTGVVGPLDTALGPALFNVAGLLNAQEITFDEVREELFVEAAADRAVRAIAAEVEPIDDLLAGGATLEELAAETPMELGEIGLRADTTDGIAAYTAFREAALAVEVGDFPELIELEDGGIVALRLNDIAPPRQLPLDEVRDQARALWQADAVLQALRAQAETTRRVVQDGRSMQALGLAPRREEGLTRDAFLEGYPQSLLGTVFDMGLGQIEILEGPDAVYLVRLDAILPPDPQDPDATFLRSVLANQANQGMAQDVFNAYSQAVQASAGLELDQTAINAVNASLQ